MRRSAISNCIRILKHYCVDPSCGEVIDVGGTETVYLDTTLAHNPLLELSPNLTFLVALHLIVEYEFLAHDIHI